MKKLLKLPSQSYHTEIHGQQRSKSSVSKISVSVCWETGVKILF